MTIAIICLSAFLISILTFFSGFGLGTVLTPIFALWFPIDLAVALTAIVHLLSNIFKFILVSKHVNKRAVLLFGIPAMLAATLGAWILIQVSDLPAVTTYKIFSRDFRVIPIKITIAILIVAFTLFELLPKSKSWTVDKKYLPLGGLLSGFFGGLSGHQGALRSAFLIRMRLSKESFIATGVAIACLIDVVRISVYSQHYSQSIVSKNGLVLTCVTLSAFCGAYSGNKLLKKVTMNVVQVIVSIALFMLAVALGTDLI